MEGSAFLFMIASWALILGLDLFCFMLLFMKPPDREPPTREEEFPEEEIT